jgi:NTP pyrophosphatase (non-canonical NTP hydrolase)
MEDLIQKIELWAEERGIFDKSDDKTQCLKFVSEAGELADAIAVDDAEKAMDGIGDAIVTLIVLARMRGVSVQMCVAGAYEVISKRTGRMVNGVFVKDQAAA